MLLVYNTSNFGKILKNEITLPTPTSSKDIFKATRLLNCLYDLGVTASFSDKDTTHSYEDFIAKCIDITADLIVEHKNKEEWEVKVSPFTGLPTILYKQKKVIIEESGKLTFLPINSLDRLRMDLWANVSPIVIPLIDENLLSRWDELKTKAENAGTDQKIKKGDIVIVKPWAAIVKETGCKVKSAPINDLAYIELPTRLYKGQVDFYEFLQAEVRTAHKNGTLTLDWLAPDVDNNTVMVDNTPVKVAEKLFWPVQAVNIIKKKECKKKEYDDVPF